MALIIPKKGQRAQWVRPFEVDGKVEKYLVGQPVPPQNPPATFQPTAVQSNVNAQEYVQVGLDNRSNGKPILISAYELQNSNNKNYENAHKFLLAQGLYMPTPVIFMKHFQNVMNAQEGRSLLYYANGVTVPKVEVAEMYSHLTKNHKNMFGRTDVGVWTWLNAGFGNGQIETVTGLDANGNLIKSSQTLEACLSEDAYVDLEFNGQGLAKPNSKSANQNYQQGKNIRFWFPRNNAVARFNAYSDWASLGCGRNPSAANVGLGVFACAEGTAVAP